MFARDLHIFLAILSTVTVLVATLEGAVRAVRGHPRGIAAGRTQTAVVMVTGMTVAAGLALLISGHRPGEWLHLVYAAFAFSLIPMADNASSSFASNRGKGLARFGGGLVCLVVLTRLFVTG